MLFRLTQAVIPLIRYNRKYVQPHHWARKRPISTTQTGTTYESLVLRALIPLAFTLERVGGRSDHGIDLLGHWSPPAPISSSASHDVELKTRLRIPAIVQCKAHVSRPHPSWARELSGAIPFAPLRLHGRDGEAAIGVLACKGALTQGIRDAVMKSERGIIWCQVGGDGRVEGMLWNKTVERMVGGLGVGFVYKKHEKGGIEKELRLTMEGRVWEIGGQGGAATI